MCGFLSFLLTDSFYRATKIEVYVKEAFRLDTSLFSCLESREIIEAKVAVTTITMSSARLYILSNYNRAEARQDKMFSSTFKYKTNIEQQAINIIKLLA